MMEMIEYFPLFLIFITKTRLYNFDPLKLLFYIVKLGFTSVYIIFLICFGAVLTSTHNLCFEQEYEKYQIFFYLRIVQGQPLFYYT